MSGDDKQKPKQPNVNLVTWSLAVITFMCVLGLLYEAVETGKDIAIQGMTNLAMIGVGALAGVLGYERGRKDP